MPQLITSMVMKKHSILFRIKILIKIFKLFYTLKNYGYKFSLNVYKTCWKVPKQIVGVKDSSIIWKQ